MKARIKDSGEIINVKFALHPNPCLERHYWYCNEKRESYDERELDFLDDEKSETKKIDWERRRYEIAKDVLAASFATPMGNVSIQSYIRDCVQIADLLIEELKK